ncbi:MAG: GMC family oxidoreductase [Rubellimicrobium sp.]|nr:GMC family oxidoreductase [Rubellimicrobium sp.]
MLIPAAQFDFAAAPPFDVAVVGAGAVGLTLAVSLARRGRRVALLEAGPARPEAASQSVFAGARAVGHPLPGLHLGRFRNLGGTTAFWGGQLVPVAPHVLGARPGTGAPPWPIGAADLAPWTGPALALLGLGAAQTDDAPDDAAIWRRLGVPAPPATATIAPFLTRWAPEPDLAVLLGPDIRGAAGPTVLIGAQVAALDAGPDGQVRAALVALPGGGRPRLSARQFVLANGTVEIARLLQFPTASGVPAPWADNPWLGRGFLDHVDCLAGRIEPVDRRRFADLFDNAVLDGIKYCPKLHLTAAAQAQEGLLDIAAHVVFDSAIAGDLANLKIMLRGLLRGRLAGGWRGAARGLGALPGTLRFALPMALRYLRHRRIPNPAGATIRLRLTAEQRPLPDSRITLSPRRRDAFGLPEADVDWRIDPRDLETPARFAELLGVWFEDNRIARLVPDPQLIARDPGFLARIDDANHHMGGARMAATPAEGVTDGHGRVFGSPNLHVAGAALYPASGFANPTFTAICLGLRLADRLCARGAGGNHALCA